MELTGALDGAGSATLSMAYAGAVFADALLKAKRGDKNVVQCTFVESPLYADKGVTYFSSEVTLGVRYLLPLLNRLLHAHPSFPAQRC